MKYLRPFINPVKWIKAGRYKRENAQYDKSNFDLELYLYSQVLKNDMLHYGYFEDTSINADAISLKIFEDAQIAYANHIIDQIKDKENPVLDVGCGMGGLANMMLKQNLKVDVLTPNKNQIDYIKSKNLDVESHHCKFEDMETSKQFGTIINSESLQYIKLKDAFDKVNKLILPNGRWIVVDYFRIHSDGKNQSGHMLEDFKTNVINNGWNISYEQDITQNILPTLRFANMYVDRFFLPIKHFAFEKLRFKQAKLYYLSEKLRNSIDKKITKERASIDTEKFLSEKKYILFALDKN